VSNAGWREGVEVDELSQADHELLAAYLEGRLSAAEALTLEMRLKQERPLARGLMLHARSEVLLVECASALSESLAGPAVPAVAVITPRRKSIRWVGTLTALAAGILLSIGGWVIFVGQGPDPDPDPGPQRTAIASLVEVQGQVEVVEQSGAVVAVEGPRKLLQGQTLRTGGEDSAALVEFADGTKLSLTADTAIRAETGAKRVYLSVGLLHATVLHANVTPQDSGQQFVVATPHAEIRVAGTRFSSSAGPTGTRVELEEGRLQLVRQSDGAVVELEEGKRQHVVQPDGRELEIHDVSFVDARADKMPLLTQPVRLLTQPRARIEGKASAFAFSPDNDVLAIAAADRVTLFDALTGKQRTFLDGTPREPAALAFSADGSTLVLVSPDPVRTTVWDLAGRRERSSIAVPTTVSRQRAALSPDGKWVAWIEGAKRQPEVLRVWNTTSGNEHASSPMTVRDAQVLVFASDACFLAAGTPTGQVVVWDRFTAKDVALLPGSGGAVTALTLSGDGKVVARGTANGDIHLLDVRAQEPDRSLREYGSRVSALAFSPDGRFLAAGLGDGTVKLWDRATGREHVTLKHHHHGPVTQLVFSPDGKSLASAVYWKLVHVWSIP